MREKISFNGGWLFHEGEIDTPAPAWKGPAYAQAKTEQFLAGPASMYYPDQPDDFGGAKKDITLERWSWQALPHDYIVTQVPDKEQNNAWGFFDYHPAWYRKHFTLPREDENKRIVLYFEGVADHCTVYLNGCILYENRESHTPFEVDITDFVRFEEDNLLAVHVIPGKAEGWWYGGGGIYRNVWLEKTSPVAVDRYGVFVAPEKADNGWRVPVQVEVRNSTFASVEATVCTALLSPAGEAVATCNSTVCVPARSVVLTAATTTVADPMLWDVDDPNLYTAVTTITVDNVETDRVETVFGFRTLGFDPNEGFFLNGRHLVIKGVCGHGDYGLTGRAVADSVYRYKARLIKEMGANSYRCSHYPQAEYWMDEMDRQGILVMAETRFFTSSNDGIQQLRTLIKRDRNHPSVFLWSIGNEERYFLLEQGARIARTLRAEVHKLDTTRPVITANDRTPSECTVYEENDLVGVNYNLQMFDMLHEKFPHKAILSTENCAAGTSRGWYESDCGELGRISAYDHDINHWFRGRENTWRFFRERPWIMGGFQWIGFEYRGEATWPRVCSVSGAIDLYLLRKDAFYQNQSLWSDKPMIHLLPHWNYPHRIGKTIKVWAYTNADEAELFLDGESLGRQHIEQPGHGEWQVVYQPGRLEAVAYKDGVEIARDVQETTGRPVALQLTAENAQDVRGNGTDVLLLTCRCVDDAGRVVPDAAPTVQFHTAGVGNVIGTGSDNADHVPVNSPIRKMYAGAISVAVKMQNTSGTLRVTAEADGLVAGEIDLLFE